MRAMMESLLEDRFQMKAHREKRDLPVYNLVLVKAGPKLSADQTPPPSRNLMIDFVTEGQPMQELPRGGMRLIRSPTSTLLVGTAVTLPRLVQMLQGQSDRIIMDRTEFTGLFDIHLQFSAAAQQIAGGDSAAPSLFTAIQEIGLKLESAKAPLDVVVVDHIEKPTEN